MQKRMKVHALPGCKRYSWRREQAIDNAIKLADDSVMKAKKPAVALTLSAICAASVGEQSQASAGYAYVAEAASDADLLELEYLIQDETVEVAPEEEISGEVSYAEVSEEVFEEEVSEEADSEEADSEEADSEEADSEEADSEEADSEEADSEEADSEEADSEEADSEEADSEEADSEEADSEEVDSEEADSEEADSEEADSEEVDSEETDSEEVDSEEADSEEQVLATEISQADANLVKTQITEKNVTISFYEADEEFLLSHYVETGDISLTEWEFNNLCKLAEAEAGNQGLVGKILVADCVLNRMRKDGLDLTSVITAPRQFASINGVSHISDETVEAVKMALERDYTVGALQKISEAEGLSEAHYTNGATSFYNPYGCGQGALRDRENIKADFKYKGHIFYGYWDR